MTAVDPGLREIAESLQHAHDSPGAQRLALAVLGFLAPDPGRLMVERVTAGARAVEAEEGLRRADEAVAKHQPSQIVAFTRHINAVAAFVVAFMRLDAAEDALRAVRPADADPERHHAQVAFILRSRMAKLVKIYGDLSFPENLDATEAIDGFLLVAGGTVGAVLRATTARSGGREDRDEVDEEGLLR